ncbi:dynamin-related protein 4C [Vigna radiata var. radiata]|uniref:Dynamin-related protein 4C n=1 Tax=Vigna radiata var. radiata TaxID=3916 RepID=A0A1S3VZH3_VIGRR|nr:dynamin-related protein 4C [Vigna radiata var. radiata]
MAGGRKSITKASASSHGNNESLALVHEEQPMALAIVAPIVSSYNERIRPVLDAMENLRRLNIAKEGIQLPSIVVVGDQSSGKSSVLESLAGISLPRGQGICTRVPLVMRLQNHPFPSPELVLEYNGKIIMTDEENVSHAINVATEELAGHGKGISNNPLTLVVKKNGVPDLTMVDLPGITRVPVHGQPENIYDQIKDIIMEYIKPEESIILNVLSASVDFTTCESIRMSQSVDKTGLRTLAVVTKADKSPEGLLEKVTADDVNIGLGYVCVRNRIGDESYEEARIEEERLFDSHKLLSKIDKSIVGIPVLAQKLVQVQAMSISKTLPEIVKKINEKLANNLSELEKLPPNLTSVADAITAFTQIIGLMRDILRKVLIRGEFDEFEENNMHCTARLVEKLDSYARDLYGCPESDTTMKFLEDEINVLEEAKWIGLPNFMPRIAFLSILQKKVRGISYMPIDFVENVWNYLEDVLITVINLHCDDYYQLLVSAKRAAQVLISKKKQNSKNHVKEAIQMEMYTDYTCNSEFLQEYNRLISQQEAFVKEVLSEEQPSHVNLEGVGRIDVAHLRKHPSSVLNQAFDLKVRMIPYWKIVQKRLIDTIALHLMLSIHNLVNCDLQKEIVQDLSSPIGGGFERLLEESPSIAGKREKLSRSVRVLRESKETVGNIINSIGNYGDF